jgi:23S rRNA (pseudouridine1915-N3)-methyltransferase
MQIHIIAIGKIREAYLKEGIEIYRNRLSPRHRVTITDVPEERLPEKYSDTEKLSAREKEGIRLIAAAPQKTVVIALDPEGVMLSSDELSARMAQWEIKGQNTLSFFIGSPLGISSAVTRQADLVLSLSRMTFPHQLVRLILIEQIYRADCIRRGIPYHK